MRTAGELERSELCLPASLGSTCAGEAHGAHFETSTVWPKWSTDRRNTVANWHGCVGAGGGASISGSPTGLNLEGGGHCDPTKHHDILASYRVQTRRQTDAMTGYGHNASIWRRD